MKRMPTIQLYLDNTSRFCADSRVTGVTSDHDGVNVTFDQTVFYPQGGGQPSDTGFIELDGTKLPVVFVKLLDGEICHYLEGISMSDIEVGAEVRMTVDAERGERNAKYHSAGHLISHIFESINPNMLPAKGHHYPDGAYIEMLDEARQGSAEMMPEANRLVREAIANELDFETKLVSFEAVEKIRPYLAQFIPRGEQIRTLTIGQFDPVPCGGTHVRNSRELLGLEIRRIKRKKNYLKVSYTFN